MQRPRPRADQIRPILLFEMAAELVADRTWPATQAKVLLRRQGSTNPWIYTLFASDAPPAIDEVVRGEVHIAMINPAGALAMACRGAGPFKEPLPVRAITVIPSYDQFVITVAERTGITSIAEIGERRYPLKISMRAYEDHADYLLCNEVFHAAGGFTLEDIVSWGGTIHKHPGLSIDKGWVERGEIDAFCEEGIHIWLGDALDCGMRILPLDDSVLRKIEPMGLRRSAIRPSDVPQLKGEMASLDFSGWPIYTHANAPDELVRAFCAALDARKDRIPWEGGWSLPLERMCKDGPDTPMTTPLHPAAEAYWREVGYLP